MTHILLATDEGMLAYSKPFRSAVSRLHGNVESQFYYQKLSQNQISEIIAQADSSHHILISLLSSRNDVFRYSECSLLLKVTMSDFFIAEVRF